MKDLIFFQILGKLDHFLATKKYVNSNETVWLWEHGELTQIKITIIS